jgi:RNA-directed DNA polymerase
MNLEQAHKDEVKKRFDAMNSKEDLVALVNYVKPLLYGKKTVPFELKQITYYANPVASGRRYKDFTIKKKSGGVRTIHAPKKGLKAIQRCLNIVLQCVFEPHKAANGFVAGKSIVDNAKSHVGNFYVYNIDLKDFFPSIDQARVWKCLQLPPFNLTDEAMSSHSAEIQRRIKPKSNRKLSEHLDNLVSEEEVIYKLKRKRLQLANMIAALCCTKMEVNRTINGEVQAVKRNVLPQGAPTSPILTNIVCQRLDHLLTGAARRFGCKYTRYADDITFSSLHNIYQDKEAFITELNRIVAEQGFQIKTSKTRLQKSGYRQEVTGLLVNEKVNVKRRYIKELRKWLYLWERYGYEKAYGLFLNDYTKDRDYVKGSLPNMIKVLDGKLNFLRMVLGEASMVYLGLARRFGSCVKKDQELLNKIDGALIKAATTVRKTKENNSVMVDKLEEAIAKKDKTISSLMIAQSFRDDGSGNSVHAPKQVVKLLNRFTEETDLKYTTHLWDKRESGRYPFKSYDHFVESYMRDINSPELSFKELPKYNRDLYWNLIHPFLIQDKLYKSRKDEIIPFKWGRHNLTVGYQYPTILKKWMAENPGRTPFEMPIPKKHVPNEPIDGKTLSYFEDFVEIFKKAIEFRRNDFYYLVRRLTDNLGIDFKVKISDLKGLNFYTDTYQVEQALERIVSQMKKNPEYPDIEISGIYDDLKKEIRIEVLQPNSYCDKPIDDDKINLKNRKGDFWLIRNKLHSLCNWSVESRFRVNNQFAHYRFNYLNETGSIGPVKLPYDTQGFKHILTFFV